MTFSVICLYHPFQAGRLQNYGEGGQLNIALWSPGRICGGVSSNLAVLATYLSSFCNIGVGLRSNHFSDRMIENYLSETSRKCHFPSHGNFYSVQGSPDYLRFLYLYYEIFGNSLSQDQRPQQLGRIRLYPPPDSGDETPFLTDNDNDLFMVDASGENSQATFKALDSADLRIIFLPGDPSEAGNQFSSYTDYRDGSLFVFNRCNEDAYREIDRFISGFRINRSNVGVLPVCEMLEHHAILGDVDNMVLFLSRDRPTEYISRIADLSRRIIELKKDHSFNYQKFREKLKNSI